MEYGVYKFSRKEKVYIVLQWIGICCLIAFFFYRSVWAFIILMPFIILYFKWKKREAVKKRKWELTMSFREAVVIVAGNLQAGNSVENAFRKTYEDLARLYGNRADIAREFQMIQRGLDSNMILEGLLTDFGKRSDVEDIVDFADIFAVAKRSGGNLREIISDTAEAISEKTEIKRELRILISEKQFEQKIMCVIPFFILAYIGLTSPGYFDSLYHNLSGIGIMTACLICYVAALLWGMKITAIEL